MRLNRDANGKIYLTARFSAANYKRLIPFFDAVEGTEEKHFRFTSEGYEPLSIEFLEETFMGCPVYSMMHFYEQNGDLMRDPDMTLLVDRDHGQIIPLSFRQDNAPFTRYGVLMQEVFADASGARYRPRVATDLDSFLNTWSKNILAQGFTSAQAARTLESFAREFGRE